jgi:hypothetical protein
MLIVGQKVVCICSWRNPFTRADVIVPTKDEIYTVRDIGFGWFSGVRRPALRLVEIRNEPFEAREFGIREPMYRAIDFRPVVERKTDITCFKEMLTPSPVTVDALNIADHARELVQ